MKTRKQTISTVKKGLFINRNFLIGFSMMSLMIPFTSNATEFTGNISFDLEAEVNPMFIPYDSKTYVGINCEAQAVAEIDKYLNVGFDMANADTGKRTVVCPVVRNNTANTNGTHSVYVNVYNPPNKTSECSLFSFDKFNVVIDSDTASTSFSGNRTLSLDVDVSLESGTYGITCYIPNTAAVRSYEVREFLSTDDRS